MSIEFTVIIHASLDGKTFELSATGNGLRMIVSSGLRNIIHNKVWGAVQVTCPDLQCADNNRQSVPTSWFMATTGNPPVFLKKKHRRILRMVHLICRDALSEGKRFRSDKLFSRKTPALQIERNTLESTDYWDPPIDVAPSADCDSSSFHSDSSCNFSDTDSEDGSPSSRKRRRTNPPAEEASHHALIPSMMSFEQALVCVRKSLPPSMQQEERFIEYATRRAVGTRQTTEEFYAWVDREEEKNNREEEKKNRDEEKKTREEEEKRKVRRIRERDVRIVVDEVFSNKFEAPCSYECGSTITVDRFYVVRDGDLFNASCSKCYRRELKAGKPGKARVADRARSKTWLRHNGMRVEGNCIHCGEAGRSIHFYLDSWHAGHDIAAANGGERNEHNMAPMHPTCNWDQGKVSFAEY